MKKPIVLVFAAMAMCLTAGAPGWAADLLILSSNAADLPEGGIIDGSKPLDLPANAKLILLSEAGDKISLEGPYSGIPGGSGGGDSGVGSRMLTAVSRLIAGKGPDTKHLGATRGAPTARSGDPWVLNTAVSGDHCVDTAQPATLWRPSADKAEQLSIKRVKSDQRASVEWPAGTATLPWPDTVEVKDRATYLVRVGGGLAVSKFVLHTLPENLSNDFQRVAWMSDKGCLRQARMLLAASR